MATLLYRRIYREGGLKMKSELGEIPNYCEKCKRLYGEDGMFGLFKRERADARTVCDECNEIEEIEQAKELGEWNG